MFVQMVDNHSRMGLRQNHRDCSCSNVTLFLSLVELIVYVGVGGG